MFKRPLPPASSADILPAACSETDTAVGGEGAGKVGEDYQFDEGPKVDWKREMSKCTLVNMLFSLCCVFDANLPVSHDVVANLMKYNVTV